LARLLGHTADAVQAVRHGHSLTDALAECPAAARPGTQALSFQVLRWLGTAQALRQRLVPKPPAPAVDALLISALALLWPEGPPPYNEHTLVDQAVEAARRRSKASAPFVNAVLRRFLRERDALALAMHQDPVAAFNHPQWWVNQLQADWPEQWQDMLRANNQRPPMTLRVNAKRSTPEAYVARLAEVGREASVVGPCAVQLAQPCAVTLLPGFGEGDVSVQDLAAQWAAPLLLGWSDGQSETGRWLPAGARVLDACAAPGGKTAHLLELAELDLLALDSDAHRLQRVRDTLARVGERAQFKAADAGDVAAWWDGKPFDAILLDAPCSAAGIVRRHPDVRWLRRASDIDALVQIQARLLDALWPLLRPGGRLLYATCSVFLSEGQHQIDAFLQRQPTAQRVVAPASPGHTLPLPDNASGPSPDGFFYALLEKS
jgi:16S rRNA (cytosine967-C5)-methyltransferase